MVSDEQIRVVCAEAVHERDPKRLQNLLEVARLICRNYIEERALFLAYPKDSSADRERNVRATKLGKRAA